MMTSSRVPLKYTEPLRTLGALTVGDGSAHDIHHDALTTAKSRPSLCITKVRHAGYKVRTRKQGCLVEGGMGRPHSGQGTPCQDHRSNRRRGSKQEPLKRQAHYWVLQLYPLELQGCPHPCAVACMESASSCDSQMHVPTMRTRITHYYKEKEHGQGPRMPHIEAGITNKKECGPAAQADSCREEEGIAAAK